MVSSGPLLRVCASVYMSMNLSMLMCVNITQAEAFGPTNGSNQQAITARAHFEKDVV